ncbi:type II secretion system protein J [Synechococcus sp. CS-1332]|uniref:PulJ/GspJ family protein n=1 Tax=Synechococcus sp. CS-1332 TaxID=2847972 RepID=UPI00223AA3B1|nr:prepilin-type N-terminal cleavage/methylation domain-containing protein [Synechococcus sp. CS-1332]MCT0207756.1 prepilin-type N-terminal cleavage/methylation domain-containing protein [Synechococcus sp. CS-1332]
MKDLTTRLRRRPHWHRGFTLVELLITSVIMGVIFATGSNVMVTQIRVSAQQESVRRLQDHWGRINHLLDSEITESASATAVANTSLTLTLAGGQTITYTLNDRTLTRSGPPINDNGTLNLTAGTPNVSSVLLTNVDAFAPTITNSREPAYTLAIADGLGASFTGLSSSSRSRTSSYP